jgi:hypothetical protein
MRARPGSRTWGPATGAAGRLVPSLLLLLVLAACSGGSGAGDPGIPAPDVSYPDLVLPDVPKDPGHADPGAPDPGPVDPGPGDETTGPADAPVEAAADDSPSDAPDAPVDAATGTPKLAVLPGLVDFGYVASGQQETSPLILKNDGTGTLLVNRIQIKDGAAITLEIGATAKGSGKLVDWVFDPPLQIAAGDEVEGTLRFAPVVPAAVAAEIRVFSNDPASPEGLAVFAKANEKVPCLEAAPTFAAFGTAVVGSHATRSVTLGACGLAAVSVTDVSLDPAGLQAGFSLGFEGFPGGVAPTAEVPAVLEPGKPVPLVIAYDPLAASPVDGGGTPVPDLGQVTVHANTFTGSLGVVVSGTAVQGACATAVATVKEGATVPAGTLLHLSGSQSSSPFGKIASYAWTVEAPAGASPVLSWAASTAMPTVFAAVPGTWTFRLQVADEAGNPTCQEAVVQVEVTSAGSAFLVLTWRPVTPAAPKPPAYGPDLDLHWLHPAATKWYDGGKDCFWYNPKPAWGDGDPAVGGTALLLDSSDGATPEVIAQGVACPAGTVYRFGVHHFDANGYGPAAARLQAYVAGALVWDREVALNDLDLWDAGTFECGSGTFTEKPGPSITPNFQDPNFVP